MRSVAPDRPGSAASQNNCSVVNLKPTGGSFATTTDHTIQMAKDSSRPGTEIHRLRRAMARPPPSQKALSSGRQSCMHRCPPARRRCAGPWIGCISGSSGSVLTATPAASALRSIWRMATCIQTSATDTSEEQQHEAARPDAGQVVQRAEGDRQHEAAEAADHADQAADRADVVGVVDGNVLEDRRLAEAHEEAEHEHRRR